MLVWRADLSPLLLHWDGAEERSGDSWHNFTGRRNVISQYVTWFHYASAALRCCDYVSVFNVWWVCHLQSANKRLYGASYSVVLQLFKVEATTLGLAGSTDLQTPVSATEGSFLCLSYFQQLEKLSKVRLNQRYHRTDNNDNTLWITIFLRMTLHYAEYYWQYVVAKALPLPVGSETNTSLPCR